jgi:glycosyltransferase involved in cell wall biosynthesis
LTKINILHLTTFLQGGAGKVVVDLAKASKLLGHNVMVACTKEAVGDYHNYSEHIEKLKKLKVSLIFPGSLFSRDKESNLIAAQNLREKLGETSPDIIHSHSATPSRVAKIYSSLASQRVPIIQTMHGWGSYKSINQEKDDVSILNEIEHVVSISESSLSLLKTKGFNAQDSSIIYNGIEKDESNTLSTNDPDLQKIYDLKRDGIFVCGVVGTVDSRKNQRLVIQAVNKLPKSLKILFHIIGEGHLIKELKELSHKNEVSEKVEFLGYKKVARQFIASFDLLISASRSEGGPPIALMEAFAEGTPVLVSDTPEHQEAVINNKTGFLFQDNDSQNLANRIEEIIHQPRNECIKNARKVFEENFRFSTTLHNYLNLYNQLLQK